MRRQMAVHFSDGQAPGPKASRWTEEEANLLLQIRAKLRASAYFSGAEDWARLFKKVDKDSNGIVDAGELWKALSIASGGSRDFKVPEVCHPTAPAAVPSTAPRLTGCTHLTLTSLHASATAQSEVRQLFALLDEDGNGGISYLEMEEFLDGRTNTRLAACTAEAPRAAPDRASRHESTGSPTTEPAAVSGPLAELARLSMRSGRRMRRAIGPSDCSRAGVQLQLLQSRTRPMDCHTRTRGGPFWSRPPSEPHVVWLGRRRRSKDPEIVRLEARRKRHGHATPLRPYGWEDVAMTYTPSPLRDCAELGTLTERRRRCGPTRRPAHYSNFSAGRKQLSVLSLLLAAHEPPTQAASDEPIRQGLRSQGGQEAAGAGAGGWLPADLCEPVGRGPVASQTRHQDLCAAPVRHSLPRLQAVLLRCRPSPT